MTTKVDPKKSVKKLYDDGMAEVFKIVSSLNSTEEAVAVAEQTAKDLTSMLVAQTLESIEARTALLSGLIVELNQVIDSVKVDPPYEDTMKSLTGVLGKAEKLYTSEKKKLV